MLPHQQRVVDEKAGLDGRIGKLRDFMVGEVYEQLPSAERERLTRQFDIMRSYSEVLGERIAAFTV